MNTNFLDPFNAKAMTFREVAQTFVPSRKFSELAGQWNALLIGPRGSGKTTLMKMLNVEALRAWRGPTAALYRSDVSYTGVYVPSDIAWGEMVRALSANFDESTTQFVSSAAFVTNVLQSVVTTMQSRLSWRCEEEEADSFLSAHCEPTHLEAALQEIADLWKLTPRSLSLQGLANALGLRLLDIKHQANLLAHSKGLNLDAIVQRMPYLGLPLVESVSGAVTSFDKAINQDSAKWALLLDEFEVAPMHLQTEVLTALRASSTKLLFKVALAPCGPHTLLDVSEATRPTRENDYKQVELWYVDKDDAKAFCTELFEVRKVRWNNVPDDSTPQGIFGATGYAIVDESGEGDIAHSYGRGPRWKKEFTELIEKDPTFKRFITEKGIDPQNLDPSPRAPNGNTIRKIAPVVAFRNAYRSRIEGNKRGRKPFKSGYSGWDAICAMSEGNPRWFIGIVNSIVASLSTERAVLPVSVTTQQEQLVGLSESFAEILRSAATGQISGLATNMPAYEVIKRIGDYFHRRLVLDAFVEDPPMSFIVDESINSDIENALRVAVNHGALVCYESPDGLGGYSSLKTKRFRLAYLLAPEFKLPLRKSKYVSLRSILTDQTNTVQSLPSTPGAPRASAQGAFSWD